ncbi:MAG: GtrA family protein [Candidatus Heimdallarchaeota archaeon]
MKPTGYLESGYRKVHENKILRFSFFNATTVLLNAILLFIFTEVGGLYYVSSAIGVIGLVGIYNFAINRKFTFNLWIVNDNSAWIQMLKWACIGLLGAFINLIITVGLTEFIGIWYIFSSTIATIFVIWMNFFLNKKWTFGDFSVIQLISPIK